MATTKAYNVVTGFAERTTEGKVVFFGPHNAHLIPTLLSAAKIKKHLSGDAPSISEYDVETGDPMAVATADEPLTDTEPSAKAASSSKKKGT